MQILGGRPDDARDARIARELRDLLDELTYVLNYGFVPIAEVIATLQQRPPQVSVVVTGRAAPEALIAAADLVTEMQARKHPFQHGRKAQIGIDY